MSITTTTRCIPTVASLSVTDLLRQAGDGDQAAWEEIMRRYHGLVLAKVRSFRLQDADAHDASQMTWLRLAENCHRIRFPEYLGGWLATAASRECLCLLDDAKYTPNPNATVVENMADPSVGPEQHVIDMDTAQTLRDLIAELEPRKQILLRALFADEPPPYAELARITGIPLGSIGPTRARALRQLRRKFDENQIGHRRSHDEVAPSQLPAGAGDSKDTVNRGAGRVRRYGL
ncbi:MAG: RNA polymerase sigma factor [Pseudonocardiaceae bacterium]